MNYYNYDCLTLGGHFGHDKTYEKIAARFYWPEIMLQVKEHIKVCDICQRTNNAKFSKASSLEYGKYPQTSVYVYLFI